MQADLYRYQHKFYEPKLPPLTNYTLDDLRLMLKGKTWEDLCNMSISGAFTGGIHFTARIGCFLCRPAVAVCALDKIIAMRFVKDGKMFPNYTFDAVLDGSSHSGFVAMMGDFQNGRLGDIKLTDLVVGEGEGL